MTKVDLIDQVAEKTELSKKEVEKLLETVITSIQNALKNGEKVSLTGLGTFIVKDKKARVARAQSQDRRTGLGARQKSPEIQAGQRA
jgi:DNA-binding protein HU-beta